MSAEVLELRGDIDLNEKPKVAAQLEPLIERQITGIVIDLSQVPYVDSSGWRFLSTLCRGSSSTEGN